MVPSLEQMQAAEVWARSPAWGVWGEQPRLEAVESLAEGGDAYILLRGKLVFKRKIFPRTRE